MLPLVAIIAVLGALLFLRARRQADLAQQPAVAALADRSPPAVPSQDAVPEDAHSALLDLGRGDCDLAAARMRTSRRRNPEAVGICLLEAATWVCAGDGPAATEAAEAYLQRGGEPNADLLWVQAQAALLQGQGAQARDRLVRLRPLVTLDKGALVDRQLSGLRSL
jgi:hypothetical protein